jgi:hypothetical protein
MKNVEYRIKKENTAPSLALRKWPKEVPVSLSIVTEDLYSVFCFPYSAFRNISSLAIKPPPESADPRKRDILAAPRVPHPGFFLDWERES